MSGAGRRCCYRAAPLLQGACPAALLSSCAAARRAAVGSRAPRCARRVESGNPVNRFESNIADFVWEHGTDCPDLPFASADADYPAGSLTGVGLDHASFEDGFGQRPPQVGDDPPGPALQRRRGPADGRADCEYVPHRGAVCLPTFKAFKAGPAKRAGAAHPLPPYCISLPCTSHTTAQQSITLFTANGPSPG
jgi:hypothetical protein